MKPLRSFCSHAGTVLSVMGMVFLGINQVNRAMAFYEHPYTKILLLALCLLLGMDTLLLLCSGRLRPGLAPIPLALALTQGILASLALWEEDLPAYTGLPGQTLAFVLCLLCLFFSLWADFGENDDT